MFAKHTENIYTILTDGVVSSQGTDCTTSCHVHELSFTNLPETLVHSTGKEYQSVLNHLLVVLKPQVPYGSYSSLVGGIWKVLISVS